MSGDGFIVIEGGLVANDPEMKVLDLDVLQDGDVDDALTLLYDAGAVGSAYVIARCLALMVQDAAGVAVPWQAFAEPVEQALRGRR